MADRTYQIWYATQTATCADNGVYDQVVPHHTSAADSSWETWLEGIHSHYSNIEAIDDVETDYWLWPIETAWSLNSVRPWLKRLTLGWVVVPALHIWKPFMNSSHENQWIASIYPNWTIRQVELCISSPEVSTLWSLHRMLLMLLCVSLKRLLYKYDLFVLKLPLLTIQEGYVCRSRSSIPQIFAGQILSGWFMSPEHGFSLTGRMLLCCQSSEEKRTFTLCVCRWTQGRSRHLGCQQSFSWCQHICISPVQCHGVYRQVNDKRWNNVSKTSFDGDQKL